MQSATSLTSGYAKHDGDHPLTERILAVLPGPRLLWIGIWALFPLFHHVVLMQVIRITDSPGYAWTFWELMVTRLPSHAVQSYMVVIAFWASRKLAADVGALRPAISRLCPAGGREVSSPFPGLSSIAGPFAFAAVVAAAETADRASTYGVVPSLLFLPYQTLWVLPMMTLPWVYIAFLVGLDRLGRQRMSLGSFPEDLSLGLGQVGATVFEAFLIFCALAVPFLFVSLRDGMDLTIGLAFFGAGVGAFFVSVWRLHRQMLETKQAHVSRAGRLYAQTYEPLDAQMTPATLQQCASPLSAAEGLMRRAFAIQEWPFDDRTMARIVGSVRASRLPSSRDSF